MNELRCPTCKGEWTHLETVHIDAGSEGQEHWQYQIDVQECTCISMPIANHGRRDTTTLRFTCETADCPEFTVKIEQHEGMTMLTKAAVTG